MRVTWEGIIPARAGFTSPHCAWTRCSTDHPRSRGVYAKGQFDGSSKLGSSPLARGLQARLGDDAHRLRIIPARAGFTPRRFRPAPRRGDHPRSRGVYPSAVEATTARAGSSPLARGLREGLLAGVSEGGIIPARAGFTWTPKIDQVIAADHPRSRGVYTGSPLRSTPRSGSSPLARGLRERAAEVAELGGIIPARAGFTRGRRSTPSTPADHPRSRGVYGLTQEQIMEVRGSSPLARGLHRHLGITHYGGRIIPARAGFTPPSGDHPLRGSDHPRSRGVYTAPTARGGSGSGSSPLARGLRGRPAR